MEIEARYRTQKEGYLWRTLGETVLETLLFAKCQTSSQRGLSEEDL